ncbi:SDR family oxidoreductase [uncultured Roseobacter sp.]|uniref:SDR family oxidoreductase n=1 Tax=uncultured Roseobacter sp. TaxID=114847 RepID=UPI002615CD4A|nr:SDR family oxidoreductase [uncultured Roseobacter sp.]
MTNGLENKTIAVFGAYGLVGSAIVARALAGGATVIALGRDPKKLDALAEELGGEIDKRVVDLEANLQTASVFRDDEKLDAIITPLGGAYTMGAFDDLTASDFMTAIQSKVVLEVNALKLSLGNLAKDGSVVFFSGLLSRKPIEGLSAMSALNGAMESLTLALASELAPLRVNCVSPGQIKPAADRADDEPTVTTPEEVADMAIMITKLNVSGSVFDIPCDPIFL